MLKKIQIKLEKTLRTSLYIPVRPRYDAQQRAQPFALRHVVDDAEESTGHVAAQEALEDRLATEVASSDASLEAGGA